MTVRVAHEQQIGPFGSVASLGGDFGRRNDLIIGDRGSFFISIARVIALVILSILRQRRPCQQWFKQLTGYGA